MVDSTGSINKADVGTQPRVNRNNDNNAPSSTVTAEKASSVDSVALTQETNEALKATDLIQESPVVDESKIANIKKALSEGNYPLDSKRTAENMMALESLLSDSLKN